MSFSCRFSARSDCWEIDGGVSEPLDGLVTLLASLDEESVDRCVLKLALDRRRNSLKLNESGAMAGEYHGDWLLSRLSRTHVKSERR